MTRASQAEERVKEEVIHQAEKNKKYVKARHKLPRGLSLFQDMKEHEEISLDRLGRHTPNCGGLSYALCPERSRDTYIVLNSFHGV